MALEDTEVDAAPEAPDDIRSALMAAVEAQEDTTRDEPVTETRARGPDGKFVKAEADEAPEPAEPVEPPAPETTEAQPATDVKTGVDAPPTWNAADKEMFKAVPPEAQAFLLRRDKEVNAEFTRKTQEIASFRRDYEPVAQMLAPHMDSIRQAGMTPATLIQNWQIAETELAAGGNRAIGLLRNVVQNYRLDPVAVARALGVPVSTAAAGVDQPPSPDGASPIQLPPEIANELTTLKQQQAAFTNYLRQQQDQQQREVQNRVMNTISEFRDAKDASGKLLHPHFTEVEEKMTGLILGERARGNELTLDAAYSEAVWANTSTREKFLAEGRAAEEAQRRAGDDKARAEARAKAERAKRAGSSVTGAPGSGQARVAQSQNNRSLRDELLASLEAVAE